MFLYDLVPHMRRVGVDAESNFESGVVTFIEGDPVSGDPGTHVYPYTTRVHVVAYPLAENVRVGIPILESKIVAIKMIRQFLNISLIDAKYMYLDAVDKADTLEQAKVAGVYLTKRL